MTFGQLDGYGRALGAALQQVADPGDRVIILATDGFDFVRAFVACQYANMIAVPAYPPYPARSAQRVQTLRSIVNNCTPTVVLIAGAPAERAEIEAVVPELRALHWVRIEEAGLDAADAFRPVPVRPADVSFLQYTSGSTGDPKGVIITHDALLHNERLITSGAALGPDDIGVSWLPLYHDMGLIGNLLGVIASGTPGVFMSPMTFLHRPIRWLQAITRYGATISGAPNFAYELCLRRIRPEDREGLELSSWKLAFSGAEPVRASTLDAFTAAYRPHGFDAAAWYACYGLAENTVMVSGADLPGRGPVRRRVSAAQLREGTLTAPDAEPDAVEIVGCGTARLHRELAIVDPATLRRCPDGTIGEIWSAGPDVGAGYWDNPEETAHTFHARIADTGEGPFLRTGDLGAVLDGELFVTGRMKDLIIVDGRNHYPADLEETVDGAHERIRPGGSIAFNFEVVGDERVAVVAEVTTRDPGELLRIERAIRGRVSAGHGLRVHEIVLVKPNSVPRTSSGKPRRRACRTAFQRGELKRLGVLDPATSV